MKKFKKGLAIIMALSLTTIFAACSGTGDPGGGVQTDPPGGEVPPIVDEREAWQKIGQEDTLIERPTISTETVQEMLRDMNFSRGLSVSKFHSNSSGGVPEGTLDFDGKCAEGGNIWSMGQWGCTTSFMNAEFSRDGSKLRYYDGSKLYAFDAAKTGNISLAIKGSVEYGKDESGNYRDRLTAIENWPHNIIGQSFLKELGTVKGADRIMWECEYTVTQCDRLTDYPVNKDLHAAQFQWFVSMYNDNPESESYRQSVWFGFSMFDTRSMNACPSGMAAYDGGKEDNTGMFIYMFSLAQVDDTLEWNVVEKPTSVIGIKRKVKVDVLPFIKAGIVSAQKKGALKGATFEDLVFSSTNIGWEIPGSYDVSVDIHAMNMYKVLKK